MPIQDKIKVLKKLKDDCNNKYKEYNKKYKKYKRYDDITDFITSILNASSISLIMSSLTLPLLIIPAGVLSSAQFIITRAQDKMKLKDKYSSFHISANQYDGLRREIITVLSKNHLDNSQYQQYIEEVHDKINLIKDTEI
jgi:hypothetical protein